MLNYNIIKQNESKEVFIKKYSADSWRLGEIVTAIGINKDRSNFTWSRCGLDTRVDTGFIVFDNNCRVSIK